MSDKEVRVIEEGLPSIGDAKKPFRILSLDGGGAKGFYTLGVLKEIEGMLGGPLHLHFDLVFGTSTGAIIASLIALGYEGWSVPVSVDTRLSTEC
jgi:predicted acylesterase/phospholipase RssA